MPAPSPSAAVVARRAGREAKSMREESGSDTDAEEPEEWDDDGEASSDEGESDEEARVSNAQRGRVRLHGVSQSSAGLEVDDDRRKSLGEKDWARRAVVVRAVGPSGAGAHSKGQDWLKRNHTGLFFFRGENEVAGGGSGLCAPIRL